MGCSPFANYCFQMGVTVMGFAEYLGQCDHAERSLFKIASKFLPKHKLKRFCKNILILLKILIINTMCNIVSYRKATSSTRNSIGLDPKSYYFSLIFTR